MACVCGRRWARRRSPDSSSGADRGGMGKCVHAAAQSAPVVFFLLSAHHPLTVVPGTCQMPGRGGGSGMGALTLAGIAYNLMSVHRLIV